MKSWIETNTLLRVGVAFAFVYPAISAWIHPFSWIGCFPPFVLAVAGSYDMVLLHTFGIVEIGIALWILFGRDILIPSTLAAAMLFGIVVFNISQIDVLFRDIPIFIMALILAMEAYHKQQVHESQLFVGY